MPSSIALWNSLPQNLKEIGSLSEFKSAITNMLFNSREIPAHFFVGSRKYSIFHSRLRNNCSNLQHDLFVNHLSNHCRCQCGHEREDAEHYLFQCNLFTNARLTLFRATRHLHPQSPNKLLFGSTEFNNDENTLIFLAVQTYIKDTRRFD